MFLHLCNRNSLAGLVHFFSFEKKNIFSIFVSTFIRWKLIRWTCNFFQIWQKKINFSFLLLHLCNRNSSAGLVHFFRFENKIIFLLFLHLCSINSLAGLVIFIWFEKKNHFFIFLSFLHLWNRNSSAGLVHFFRFDKKNYFFYFLFLHLCNRNSLGGLVNFFRLKKKFIFSFSYCFYIYVIETH